MNFLRTVVSSLAFRLAIASALVIALCVVVLTKVLLDGVSKRSERTVLDIEGGTAERMAQVMARRVVLLQTALRAAATPVSRLPAPTPEALREILARSPVLYTLFANVFIAMPDGTVVAWGDERGVRDPGISMADRTHFKQTVERNAPVVSDPILGRISNQPIVQLTMPVRGADGKLLIVIGGSLQLGSRNLAADLTENSLIESDPVRTIVTDLRGRILAHGDPSRLLKPIEEEPGMTAAVQRWVAQGRPIEPMADVLHADGYFVAMAGVPGADWMVFRVAQNEAMLGGVLAAHRESRILGVAVACAGGVLLAGLLWWMLRPVRLLRERAAAFGDGRSDDDALWPAGRDEISDLGRALRAAIQARLAGELDNAVLAGQMRSVMAAAPIGIAFSNHQKLQLVGREFAALLGHEVEADLVGRPSRDIFASELDYEMLGGKVGKAFEAGQPYFGEVQFVRRDGSVFWGRLQGRPVQAGNAAGGTIWLLEDVTQRREARERLSWSAHHDSLTRLLNRAAFEARLADLIAASSAPDGARGRMPAALLFIDLDRFKAVNDSAGHAAGDSVLKAVAAMLLVQVRGTDSVARLGGDEFAVLLEDCKAADAVFLAEKIRTAAELIGVDEGGQRLCIGASVGVTVVPATGASVADLLACADAACYAAKRAGRNSVKLHHFSVSVPAEQSTEGSDASSTAGEPAAGRAPASLAA